MRAYVCVRACVRARAYECEPSHGERARAPFDNLLHITEDSFGADREGARERDATITGEGIVRGREVWRRREGASESKLNKRNEERERGGEGGGGKRRKEQERRLLRAPGQSPFKRK